MYCFHILTLLLLSQLIKDTTSVKTKFYGNEKIHTIRVNATIQYQDNLKLNQNSQ